MKSNKKSSLSNLYVDVAEYMFIEWLVRHGVYSVYRANRVKFCTQHRTFRQDLRAHLRDLLHSTRFTLSDIMDCSFPFAMTPQGYKFWTDQSALWRNFCKSFDFTL